MPPGAREVVCTSAADQVSEPSGAVGLCPFPESSCCAGEDLPDFYQVGLGLSFAST
jgi:hypothetical protein